MKERPMLMSAPMVRAILAGTKTQTRRVVKQTLERLGDGDWYAFDHKGINYRVNARHTTVSAWANLLQFCPCGRPVDRIVVAQEIPSVGRNYCAGSNGVIYSRARGDWRPLKAHGNGNGYPCVTVMDGSRKTTRAVHSLVCEAFYGAAPFGGAQVRHLDGDTENSLPNNLAWGTQAENWHDRRCHGNGMDGEKHHAAKLTDDERAHVRWAIERGLCSQRHAARMLGMTQSSIGQMMNSGEVAIVEQDIPCDRIPLILLEIVSVRVERLQEISEADAIAEGIERVGGATSCSPWRNYRIGERGEMQMHCSAPTRSYMTLWESINGPGSWAVNPWVWVVEFKRVGDKGGV